jgi:SAM-dependent methyltransferase
MKQFRNRSTLPELMDQPGVEVNEIHKALRELNIINTWLGGYTPVLSGLKEFASDETITVADIGSGGGDVARKIWKWAQKKRLKIQITGVDINPAMTAYSIQQSATFPGLHFKTGNAMNLAACIEQPDLIVNTLFCHHFDDEQLILLIQSLKEQCKKGFIINDLHRHWFAWASIKFLTFLFSNSYLVKYDGPLSVKRSLTRKEWISILTAAGITQFKIRWFWAWRWQIIYHKIPDND